MPFQKGHKLSKGRPNKNIDVQAIARQYTTEAIQVLADIMQDDQATAASRVSAAEAILSRGWGKPAQAVTGEGGGPIALSVQWLQPTS